MKRNILFLSGIVVILAVLNISLFYSTASFAKGEEQTHETEQVKEHHTSTHTASSEHGHAEQHEASKEHHGAGPAAWSVIPFALLLIMIATGPLFFAHFWHKNYPIVAASLGAIIVGYYLFVLHDYHHPIHSLAEYASFIALLTALFVASGGILINVDKKGTPMVNVLLLIIGAVIANIIGTTGASMLLIRPFIRLNKDRIKPYHIVFFIFMVSNVGGALTPIGDPPLFLGFLKGVPFSWTLLHVWIEWAFGIGLLSLIFLFVDRRNKGEASTTTYSGNVSLRGSRNIIFLAITIGAVFLDPNVLDWVPAITYHGDKFSFLRELIMFGAAFLAFKTADKECLKGNSFDFEPIKEVAFLFIGIFATMMPALQLISEFATSESGQKLISVSSLYWITGTLSGVLDNAPTYLNFLAAGMGKFGLDINLKAQVLEFSIKHAKELMAISVSSVFFGAMTYIGNAPNFMVKAIAEQVGIKMPSFVGYVIRYSIPILLPVLFLTWIVFFSGFVF